MSATESLSIGLGLGVSVPIPLTSEAQCGLEELEDGWANWQSPYRPAYQCVIDGNQKPSCVRRGTFGGVAGGGYGVSAVTAVLAPRAFPLYPSCDTCMAACSLRASELSKK